MGRVKTIREIPKYGARGTGRLIAQPRGWSSGRAHMSLNVSSVIATVGLEGYNRELHACLTVSEVSAKCLSSSVAG
jgi:hypothetical protein